MKELLRTNNPVLISFVESLLGELDIHAAVINARFAKPIDAQMVRDAFEASGPIVTVEDHSVAGGFGSAFIEAAHEMGLTGVPVTVLGMPRDRFIAHGPRPGQLAECGIDATGIAAAVQRSLENAREFPESRTGLRALSNVIP